MTRGLSMPPKASSLFGALAIVLTSCAPGHQRPLPVQPPRPQAERDAGLGASEVEHPDADVESGTTASGVRDIEPRSPTIEVLASYRPGGRDDMSETVSVVGADLSARKVLLHASREALYARSGDLEEFIDVVELESGRRLRKLRRSESFSAADGGEASTASVPRAIQVISKLMDAFELESWGDDVWLTRDRSHLVGLGPDEDSIVLMSRAGRRVRSLLGPGVVRRLSPFALSPDGRTLALTCWAGAPSDEGICTVALETGALASTPMESAANPVWADEDTFYVASYRHLETPDGDYTFEACLQRVEVSTGLRVEQILCAPAWLEFHSLYPAPDGTTAVMTLKSPVRMDSHSEIGVLWFRLSDGEVLARRSLPPASRDLFVADGPLVVSYRDPNIDDGHLRTDDAMTVLDLASGDRTELTRDTLGGFVSGFYLAERDGAALLLAVRQPDILAASYEIVGIDLASAFPPR